MPEADGHERVHAIHRQVSLPAFGAHVFYVEECLDDDPNKVFRQRLVAFESARDQGFRMRLWFFRDSKRVRGAHEDPGRLAALTPDDVSTVPECDVYWQPQADQYVGGMRGRSCQFGAGRERRWSQHDLVPSQGKR